MKRETTAASRRTARREHGILANLRYDMRKNPVLLLIMLPSVAFFIIFSYIPMVGVYYAFTKYNVRGGLFGSPFVGLDNFKFLFQSGKVWTLTANTILYNAIFIAGGLVLKVSFAIMLAEMSHKLVKKVSQTLMFLPHFVSMVLVGTMAYSLFNYNSGFINTVLTSMGLERFDFYGTPWIWYVIIPLVWYGGLPVRDHGHQ